MLKYVTGAVVSVGDRVYYDGEPSCVARVFLPGTEETEGSFCSAAGGVLLAPSHVVAADAPDWSDLELLSRAQTTEKDQG